MIAFSDIDPSTPPPQYKEVIVLEEASSDDKDKAENDKSNKI